jgi:hypothetical protein
MGHVLAQLPRYCALLEELVPRMSADPMPVVGTILHLNLQLLQEASILAEWDVDMDLPYATPLVAFAANIYNMRDGDEEMIRQLVELHFLPLLAERAIEDASLREALLPPDWRTTLYALVPAQHPAPPKPVPNHTSD